jgi:hypothetical protein
MFLQHEYSLLDDILDHFTTKLQHHVNSKFALHDEVGSTKFKVLIDVT